MSSTFIKTLKWIQNKNCTINPKNKGNKCFQYSVTLSLYHQEIKYHPARISKIKPFINNLNWENINFPTIQQDYQQLEVNNKCIALNILQILNNEISHYYKSQHNKTRENKVILLMITDNNNKQNAEHLSHYLVVKRLNALLKNKNDHNTSYFCIDCFKKFRIKSKLEKHCQQH